MRPEARNPIYDRLAGDRPTRFHRIKQLRRDFQFVSVWLLLQLAAALSVRAAQRLGRGLAYLLFPLLSGERAICDYQLGLAYPDLTAPERRRLSFRGFQNLGMTLMETLAIRRMRRRPEYWVQLENVEVIEKAHAKGRGVIFITGHMANWELLSIVFDQLRIPGQAFVRSIVNERLNQLLLRYRSSEFMRIVLRGSEESPRQLLRCLKNGDALVVALDHDTRVPGVFVNFFGMPAYTPRVAASLALRGNVPVVSGFGRRLPDGRHRFRYQAFEPPEGAVNDTEGVRRFTQQMTDAVEAHIRECPEQWTWSHRRWQTLQEDTGPSPDTDTDTDTDTK